MKNFSRDRRSGGRNNDGKFGRRDGGRRDFGGEREGGRPTMYPATCADCGNPCEVPFQPRDGRPVYCNNCFDKSGSRDQRRPDSGRDRRPNDEDRRMFSATCDECGNPCEVPFRPTAGKPVFCKSCFGKKGGRKIREDAAPTKQGPDQFAALHAKLDKIISVLATAREHVPPTVPAKAAAKAKLHTKTKKKAK